LTACAGTVGCRKALSDVRAAAQQRALVRAATDPPEHWAACERRCGEVPGTPVAIAVRAVGEVEVRSDARTRVVASLEHAARHLATDAPG
jgi:hypothetical protein